MENILNYLEARGNLTLDEEHFNDVDALILCRLSYMPFEKIVSQGSSLISLKTAVQPFIHIRTLKKTGVYPTQKDRQLLTSLANSRRFGQMYLTRYSALTDPKTEKQFAAVTILTGDGLAFLSFRGTDETLVGLKEDFNMSFISPIPAQEEALRYLGTVTGDLLLPLRLGGHSKGGNLAVYASAFAPPPVQERITANYNCDGPGFPAWVLENRGYQAIKYIIRSIVPQSSIIGMLLEHEENYTVVKSVNKGLLQHDIYSWEVENGGFSYLRELTGGSRYFSRTLKKWLAELTPEQREKLIDQLFDLFSATNAQTISDLTSDWLRTAVVLLEGVQNIDPEMRRMIHQALALLEQSAISNLIPGLRQNDS